MPDTESGAADAPNDRAGKLSDPIELYLLNEIEPAGVAGLTAETRQRAVGALIAGGER